MNTQPAEIEIYASIECPYAYLATYRLKQLRPEYTGRVRFVWRALSLEYINQQSYPKPLFEAEYELFQRIEPELPWQRWTRPDWQWPTTHWPAFEALACAQAQGEEVAFQMSWALRHAYFAESRCISLRHELLDIAKKVAASGLLNLERFISDWDSGRYKNQIVEESEKGWRSLKLDGSATFVLPDGTRITNPAIGDIDFDESNNILRSYTPFSGDPLFAYRGMLDGVKHTK